MRNQFELFGVLVLASGFLLHTSRLSAQEAARCTEAANLIDTTRISGQQTLDAILSMSSCPDTGPGVLSRLWAQPNLHQPEIDAVMGASWSLPDASLLPAVLLVTRTPGETERRLAALIVLAHYLHPSVAIGRADSNTRRVVFNIGETDHFNTRQARNPLSATDREVIRNTIREIGYNDGDRRVRTGALNIYMGIGSPTVAEMREYYSREY